MFGKKKNKKLDEFQRGWDSALQIGYNLGFEVGWAEAVKQYFKELSKDCRVKYEKQETVFGRNIVKKQIIDILRDKEF